MEKDAFRTSHLRFLRVLDFVSKDTDKAESYALYQLEFSVVWGRVEDQVDFTKFHLSGTPFHSHEKKR